jgi:thiamine-monophosphate kinase
VTVGDDAAVSIPSPGTALLHTIDTLVEGVDFHRRWIDLRTLGRRALAINLSDIAAMGGDRAQAVVSLCLPRGTPAADVEAFYSGLREMADRTGTRLVGGDLSAIAGPWVITVAVVAEADPSAVLLRSGAHPGWAVAVTGRLGGAAAGLRELLAGTLQAHPSWQQRQLDPTPRLREGLALAAAGVRVAGDISDGLVRELERIAENSGTGADVELARVPVEPGLVEAFEDWPLLALAGGEDFELVCAAPDEILQTAARALASAGLAPLTVCGRLRSDPLVQVLDGAGKPVRIPRTGFDHFA